MKINVLYQFDTGTPITCTFNDYCNHAGAKIVTIDYGRADPYISDYVDDWRQAIVCDKCENIEEFIDYEPDYERY